MREGKAVFDRLYCDSPLLSSHLPLHIECIPKRIRNPSANAFSGHSSTHRTFQFWGYPTPREQHRMTPPLSIRSCSLDIGSLLDKEAESLQSILSKVALSGIQLWSRYPRIVWLLLTNPYGNKLNTWMFSFFFIHSLIRLGKQWIGYYAFERSHFLW